MIANRTYWECDCCGEAGDDSAMKMGTFYLVYLLFFIGILGVWLWAAIKFL